MNWSNPQDAARKLVGNWLKFDSFYWHDKPDDAENWCLVYTHHRDSGLLDQSNADAIEAELKPFLEADEPNIVSEHHNHWGVGWVDGYAIRVYTSPAEVTDVFAKWCEIQASLEDYPVLDEEDYSKREYEATLENIEQEGSKFVNENADEDWPAKVFTWLWDYNQKELENVDDQGGYPSAKAIKESLYYLGLLDPDIDLEEFGDDGLPYERWAVIGIDKWGEENILSQYSLEFEAANEADRQQRWNTEYVRYEVKRIYNEALA